MRRVVTGDVDGRSTVVIDGETPVSDPSVAPKVGPDRPVFRSDLVRFEEVWLAEPGDPLGEDPETAPQPVEPLPLGSAFRVVTMPPDKVIRQLMREAAGAAGTDGDGAAWDFDEEGFHRTRTLDYTIVLDGPVELVLDTGAVQLAPGDVVVQRATNHVWRNNGDEPMRLLTVMIGAEV